MAVVFWQFSFGVVLLFLSINLPLSDAQTDTQSASRQITLSIDCGSTVNHTDSITGITWVSDDSYIRTGKISNITAQLPSLSPQHRSLRFFPEKQSKFCYELPATSGTTYLVRTTFMYDDYDGRSIPLPSFQLQIDTSSIGLIRPDNLSNWESVIEVIMLAVAPKIQVCLAPAKPGTDVPFINAIELRELGPFMYLKARQGYMMITNHRYNFGFDHDLRYPDDPYDRLWRKYPSSQSTGSVNLTADQSVLVNNSYSFDNAPTAVMNTALTWPTGFSFTLNVSGDSNYVILLWFAEIDLEAKEKSREFVVGVDEQWQDPINILDRTRVMYLAYEWGYPSIVLSATSTIAFRSAEKSQLGPILNAMEVYGVSDPVQPKTELQDVAAIEAVKSYWPKLTTWTGDPCLALPYDWTSCSVDSVPRITNLELDGYNLTGSVPASEIRNLTELMVLSLTNNSLDGSVPDLSSLQKLQQLHLQNNNLSGEFPAWVADLPNLQKLSVEGNILTGYVPQSLFNSTRYTFTFTRTTGLCTGSSRTNCSTDLSPAALKSSSSKLAIIIGSVAGVLGLIVLIGVIVCLWRCKRILFQYTNSISSKQLLKADPEAAFASTTKSQTVAYSFKEIKEATNNFQNQISEESFGPVYKGKLFDGREVAVKRCRPCNKQETTAFFDEVEFLARIHHRNLTALVGFCKDAQEQILLYEYRSNSDLWTHLHGGGKPLSWSTRLSIALDVALGIEYLHTGFIPSIIHRDVQPHNILLTRNMTAKVANCAFAKFTSDHDPTLQVYSADVKGTAGSLDPEYAVSRQLTEKSDVYSFGVVLLELVSGQKPIDKAVSNRNPLLIEWMRPQLAEGNIEAVVDPSLGNKYNEESMWKVAELGMMCVEPRLFNRPTMAVVVQDLREAITLEGITHPSMMTPLASPRSGQSSGPM